MSPVSGRYVTRRAHGRGGEEWRGAGPLGCSRSGRGPSLNRIPASTGAPRGASPSRSAEGDRPHDLPAQVNSFVGRHRELAQLGQLLATTRLLTLTGAGGVGKTRLALKLAVSLTEAYRDGVRLATTSALMRQRAQG